MEFANHKVSIPEVSIKNLISFLFFPTCQLRVSRFHQSHFPVGWSALWIHGTAGLRIDAGQNATKNKNVRHIQTLDWYVMVGITRSCLLFCIASCFYSTRLSPGSCGAPWSAGFRSSIKAGNHCSTYTGRWSAQRGKRGGTWGEGAGALLIVFCHARWQSVTLRSFFLGLSFSVFSCIEVHCLSLPAFFLIQYCLRDDALVCLGCKWRPTSHLQRFQGSAFVSVQLAGGFVRLSAEKIAEEVPRGKN